MVWEYLGAKLPWNSLDSLHERARCYMTNRFMLQCFHLTLRVIRSTQEADEQIRASHSSALSESTIWYGMQDGGGVWWRANGMRDEELAYRISLMDNTIYPDRWDSDEEDDLHEYPLSFVGGHGPDQIPYSWSPSEVD